MSFDLLPRRFAAAVLRHPERPAVTVGDPALDLTFAELDRRARRLAGRLRALGVGPERLVAVALDRTPDLAVALWAVLQAGGAWVALDPSYPPERLRFLVEDLGAAAGARPVVLTQERFAAILPLPAGAVVCCLDAADDAGEEAEGAFAPAELSPDHLAHVIYTSGSTGRPKGIGIRHGSVAALADWAAATYAPAELAGVFAGTSIHFDMSVFELLVVPALGGRVILGKNALDLHGHPQAQAITLLNTVPSAVAELVLQAALPPGLTTVNLGGEPLRAALVERIFATGTVERVWNLYGPSEDTTYSTAERVPRGDPAPSIGRPLPGSRGHLLAADLQPVAVGAGELYLAGAGLARGYLGRPDLTAERFLPDPFAAEPGERMYRTGDRVRELPDGRLDSLGRVDQQVKVRGFRIELGEVEAALSSHPQVREAAAFAPEDAEGVRTLAAFVSVNAPHPAVAELKAFVAARLPGYMVPTFLVALPELPLLPHGKIDRQALDRRARALQPAAGAGEAAAPRTPMEARVAALFAEVLGLAAVGGDGSFFELGGDSLKAARLAARLGQGTGVEVDIATLFRLPEVGELARWLEGQGASAAAADAAYTADIAEAPGPRARPARPPLSFAQERLWFLDRLAPGQTVYGMPLALRLEGELAPPALAAALADLVARHEDLRTTFPSAGGVPWQRIAAPSSVAAPLPVADLGALPTARREAEHLRLLAGELERVYDLERGPLFAAWLIDLEAGRSTLVLSLHHIVADGFSLAILVAELAALYAAHREGRPAPLAPLPLQYADFALWQREIAEARFAAWLDGWREELAGAPDHLELPADRPRPAVPSFRGRERRAVLGEETARRVGELARRARATPYMVHLCAFFAWLHRLTGEGDLVLGTPAANRTHPALEGLIGFFVNTLPLRARPAGEMPFAAFLAEVRGTALAAFARQELPLERLVEALGVERSLAWNPLFQVLLAYQEVPEIPALPGLTAAWQPLPLRAAKLDLSLIVDETAHGTEVALEHALDLFDGTTAQRYLGAYLALLEGAAATPARPLADLPLLAAAERHQLAREWSRTEEGEAGPEVGIVERIAEWAARTPAAAAVIGEGATLSYGELDRLSTALGRRLAAAGVGPEVPVAVSLPREPGWVVALLAIWKAGGVYLPIDPAYPAERRRFLLEDAGARIVLTRPGVGDLGEGPWRLWDLDGGEGEALAAPALPRELPADRLAYLIYTSGSTGTPKGVGVSQAAISAHVPRIARLLRVTAADRLLAFVSFAFDASFEQILVALIRGAALVVRGDDPWGVAELPEHLCALGCTLVDLPPAYLLEWWRQAAAGCDGAGGTIDGRWRVPRLRAVVAGGEAVPRELALLFAVLRGRAFSAQAEFWNAYGPTEAVASASWLRVPLAEPDIPPGPALPIGRPLPGRGAYVLAPGLSPAPIGVGGELHLSGLLAHGYAGRPELTAERFLPDPWAEAPGARLYRTGDLARFLPDGRLEFLGRVDRQVKVRGFRIELAEIEAALRRHPAVGDAAVLASADPRGGLRLVAFVVADPGQVVAGEALRAFLAGALPEHMVPAAFVPLPSLPATVHGKVDRRALERRVPPPEAGGAGEGGLPPETAVELAVAALWCELLAVPAVGLGDSFFGLGGHSLLAVRLLARLPEALGVELPLKVLFETPRLGDFARRVAAALAAGVEERRPIPRTGAREAPLTLAQEGLWFVDRLRPGQPVYNLPAALRLAGALDVAALFAALAEVERRQGALRTTFGERDGEPFQRLGEPRWGDGVPLIDLAGLPGAAGEAELARRLAAEALEPFALVWGPLFRPRVLRLSPVLHVLSLTAHHTVSDGGSLALLAGEIGDLYRRFGVGLRLAVPGGGRSESRIDSGKEGEPCLHFAPPAGTARLPVDRSLPPLPVQYVDFALWQRGELTEGQLAGQLGYWRQALAGAPTLLDLPLDRPRPLEPSFRGWVVPFAWDAGLAADLARTAARYQVSPFMVGLALVQAFLGGLSGQEELLLGTPLANRGAQTQGVVGYFVNTVVLRGRPWLDRSFVELLGEAAEAVRGAFAHPDLPVERLVGEGGAERSLSYNPLFQAMFVWNEAARLPEIPGLAVAWEELPFEVSKVDLTVGLETGADGGITGYLEAAADLFDRATALRWVDSFGDLARAALAAPASPLGSLPRLAGEEGAIRTAARPVGRAFSAGPPARLPRVAGEPPLPGVEAELAGLWRDLLGAGPVARGDSFFDLGGHSLSAVRLVARIRQELGADLPVRAVFEAPTLAALAEVVAAAPAVRREPPLVAGPRPERIPLSFGQERLWFLERLAGGRSLYGMPMLLELAGPLDRRALAAAVAGVVRRHEILRTTYPEGPDGPYQRIAAAGAGPAVAVPVIDLAGLAEGSRERAAVRALEAIGEGLFDLERGPVARFALLSREAEGHTLVAAFHHIAADGASVEIFGTDLAAFYRTAAEGPAARPPALPDLPLQYADFALWQRRWLAGSALAEPIAFWRRELAGAPTRLALPTDRPRPEEPSFAGRALPVALEPRVAAAVRALAQGSGATPFMVLLAALFAALARLAGQEDLLVGSVVAGRHRRELEPVFGFFVNTLVLRGRVAADEPFTALLAAARSQTLDAYAHQDLPFERLVDEVGAKRTLSGNPLFQVLLMLETAPLPLDLGGLAARWGELPGSSAKFDLTLSLREGPGSLAGQLEYATDLFDRATAQRLAGAFARLLVAAVDRPGTAVGELPLLSPEERRQLAGRGEPVDLAPLPDLTRGGEMGERRAGAEPGADAPAGPAQELLAGIWRGLLGVEHISVHDSFFDLGGHSLTAARLSTRLWAAFGLEVSLADVFAEPTLGGMAARLTARAGLGLETPAIVPVPRDRPLPLSFSQQRLWFLDRLAPGKAAYDIPFTLGLSGALDRRALAATLGEIVRRHEALRTTFPEIAGEPRQRIAPPAPFPLPDVDLTALPGDVVAREAAALLDREARRPFDLARGPLFRAALLKLAPREHRLLGNLHHIVADGWSMEVLRGELAALYAAFASGHPSPLPPLPVQYADYAVWQRAFLAGEALERAVAFWRDTLAGVPAALDLPADRPRPAFASLAGGERPLPLPAGTGERVAALARRESATLFMVLLAAFEALLARLSGAADFAVGTPVANRGRAEIEGLIGFFVNTLPLRARVDSRAPFGGLVAAARAAALAAFSHPELPFERLVDLLGPARSLAHNPLYQVLFTLARAGRAAASPPGLALAWGPEISTAAKVDLEIGLIEREGELAGVLGFASDLFDGTTADRFARAFAVLLADALADPARPVGELALLDAAERHQLQHEWSTAPAAAGAAIPARVAEWAARTPEAPAIAAGGLRLTYGELDRRAARLARHLERRGVGKGSTVGLFLGRGAGLAAAALGVWKAGAAYLPLDPGQPEARLAYLLGDGFAGDPLVITEEGLVERLRAAHSGAVPVLLDLAGDGGNGGEPAGFTAALAAPGDLAYLIYTSGTTGHPKAVEVEHGSLAAMLAASQERFPLAPGDRFASFSAHTFDVFLYELFGSLLAGAEVELVDTRGLDLPAWVAAAGEITALHAVPALMREVVAAVERGPGSLPGVRHVFMGGDVVPVELFPAFPRAFPGARVTVLYGPTEGAIFCSFHTLPPLSGQAAPRALLGRALPGAVLEVLDAAGLPAPIGVPGEIWLGGPGVSRGYRGRPELTAERFVPDGAGRRRYRTGDLARFLPDGNLEFLGRMDDQVKVRGFRIELGEIEAALAEHPAVREVAVIVRLEAGERRPVACVVPAEGAEEDPAPLHAHLASRLPEYMLPAGWAFLPELPLSVHGKVDRKALAALAVTVPVTGSGGRPETPLEIALAALWRELLGLDEVGADDSFFSVGGHSLLATRLVSRLAADLGVELPVRAVFEAPTLRALARAVAAAQEAGPGSARPALVAAPRRAPIPLSFAQERLWFLSRLHPDSPFYNVAIALTLQGELRIAALWGALAAQVRRHETLRTTFPEEGGRPCQRIAPPGPPAPSSLPIVDLSGLPDAVLDAEVQRAADRELARAFDLERGPVSRSALLVARPGEWVLLQTFHHIASDGWSAGIFADELAALYRAALVGEASPLPALPIQYADFALWQRSWLHGEALAREVEHWRRELAGLPRFLPLPTDRPRPPRASFRGRQRMLELPEGLLAAAEGLAREAGATLFMVLLAVFELLLARFTGRDDFAVGTPIAGRNRHEVEGLLGCFLNTLVLRGRPAAGLTFREHLARVRAGALTAYAHQDVPFEKLVEELGVERNLAYNPLFQVMFSLQNAPLGELKLPGLAVGFLDAGVDAALFDLAMGFGEYGGQLHGGCQYATDLFDEATIDQLLAGFVQLLEAATADPDQKLAELPGLPELEARQAALEPEPTAAAAVEEGEGAAKAGALRSRLSGQEDKVADLRSALSDKKRAALDKLLRAKAEKKLGGE